MRDAAVAVSLLWVFQFNLTSTCDDNKTSPGPGGGSFEASSLLYTCLLARTGPEYETSAGQSHYVSSLPSTSAFVVSEAKKPHLHCTQQQILHRNQDGLGRGIAKRGTHHKFISTALAINYKRTNHILISIKFVGQQTSQQLRYIVLFFRNSADSSHPLFNHLVLLPDSTRLCSALQKSGKRYATKSKKQERSFLISAKMIE